MPLDALGRVAADQVDVPPLEGGEVREDVRLAPPVEEVGGRDRLAPVSSRPARSAVEHHDALGLGGREGPQHERVDDAEDRRVGAEAEGQRHDDEEGEAGALEEGARGDAKGVHVSRTTGGGGGKLHV